MMKTMLVALFASVTSLLGWSSQVVAETVQITARNDVPGPVTAVLQLRDRPNDPFAFVLLEDRRVWARNDNTYSVMSWIVSDDILDDAEDGGVLRITFIDDQFQNTGNEDDDRNLFIDNLEIDDEFREGEFFDFTGGRPGEPFAGCGGMFVIDGRAVADCGNEGDWVEYLLEDEDEDDEDDDD